jgi:hypothetical protein
MSNRFIDELARRVSEMAQSGLSPSEAIEAALDQAAAEMSMRRYQSQIDACGGIDEVKRLAGKKA